jgi:hypothetical protein
VSDQASAPGAGRPRAWTRHWRTALLLAGLVVTGLIVREVGPAVVARTMLSAGVYLPLLMTFDGAWSAMDVFVLRALLGETAGRAPPSAYARSAVTAYAVHIFFPAGRASAEVMRATMLSPYLGASRVALAAMQLHGVSLLGTALISLVALAVTVGRLGLGHRLSAVIGMSTLLTGALGGLVLFGARAPRLWAFLRARIAHFRDLTDTTGAPWPRLARAIFLSFAGRVIQIGFFAVAVLAATGELSLGTGAIAQGVSLAGSTFGYAVPQQAGVAEGAFFNFAGALGLAAAPAKAVAIALVVRVSQASLALVCLLVGFAWRERGAPRAALDEVAQPPATAPRAQQDATS